MTDQSNTKKVANATTSCFVTTEADDENVVNVTAKKRWKVDSNNDQSTEIRCQNATSASSRIVCHQCDRLVQICICAALPRTRIRLHRTHCFILQHSHELRHKNRSVPIVELCIDPESITVHPGKILPTGADDTKNKHFKSLFQDENPAWLIYPSNDSISLTRAIQKLNDSELQHNDHQDIQVVTLIFIDATWRFAKEMIRKNEDLFPSHMWRVRLDEDDFEKLPLARRFEIRTPPSEQHKSTAECIAWVLSRIEDQPNIYETIMKPLDLMVEKWTSFIPDAKKSKKSSPQPHPNDKSTTMN
jgi:DTW domain-containing protein YfiP